MIRARQPSMRLALALLVTGTSLIGALLGLSGCGGTTSSSTQGLPVSQDQHYSQIVSMDASWSVGYKDLKTLKAASTSIVAGTIAAVAGATLDTTTNIPYTDFTVALEQLARSSDRHELCNGPRYACLFDRFERAFGASGG